MALHLVDDVIVLRIRVSTRGVPVRLRFALRSGPLRVEVVQGFERVGQAAAVDLVVDVPFAGKQGLHGAVPVPGFRRYVEPGVPPLLHSGGQVVVAPCGRVDDECQTFAVFRPVSVGVLCITLDSMISAVLSGLYSPGLYWSTRSCTCSMVSLYASILGNGQHCCVDRALHGQFYDLVAVGGVLQCAPNVRVAPGLFPGYSACNGTTQPSGGPQIGRPGTMT